jgi:hypothetical protein
MRRLVPLLLAILAFAPLPANAATSTVTYGSQGWWRKTGISVPANVGAHIHLDATIVRDGIPVDGRLDIPVTVTLHDAAGKTSWVRAGTESQTLFQQSLVLGPCANCSASLTVSLNLAQVPTGRHEIRMSANIPDEDPALSGSQRFFQTWNAQLCVRACTPTYRAAGPAFESRSWYQDHNYQNAKLTTALSSIRSGGTIGVRLGPGSGGLATKFAGVYIDPDFHAGSAGIVVRTWTAAFTGSVTLPSLASGSHRLVLLSSDGQNAGVLSVPFVVP